ncbi:TPA: hypothetical protein IV251_002851 [Enterococcus faecium]|nr:hypothetical protein [Enterococcus faecium]
MTTTGKKLKVIFMLIILSLSNFVPLSAIADTTDDPTVLETISAEVISDQSGKKALNIKLNANNTSAEKIEKEIGLVENYLSDVERKEGDGYAYQVNSGKITLEISSNTKQTIDLSFPIDPALYHSQANFSLEEIANRIGYKQTTSLFKLFKKYSTCTPNEWRNKH